MSAITRTLQDKSEAPGLIDIGDSVPWGRFDRIVSRFDSVVNFAWEDRVISVVGAGHYAGALRLRLDLDDLEGIRLVEHKEGHVLINGDTAIRYGNEHIYCSEMGQFAAALTADTVSHLSDILHRNSRGNDLCFLLDHGTFSHRASAIDRVFQDRFIMAYDHIVQGELNKGISLFKGCGYGLTPAGDDFICGLLMGLYLLDEKNELSKIRETIYSFSTSADALVNAMQYQAYHGYFDADWKGLALALQDGSPYLETGVQAVLQSGETSGVDKLTGFITALTNDWIRM